MLVALLLCVAVMLGQGKAWCQWRLCSWPLCTTLQYPCCVQHVCCRGNRQGAYLPYSGFRAGAPHPEGSCRHSLMHPQHVLACQACKGTCNGSSAESAGLCISLLSCCAQPPVTVSQALAPCWWLQRELTEQWQREKEDMMRLTRLKEEIERVNLEIQSAERDYDLNRAAELKYGTLLELQKQLKEAEEMLEKEVGAVGFVWPCLSGSLACGTVCGRQLMPGPCYKHRGEQGGRGTRAVQA